MQRVRCASTMGSQPNTLIFGRSASTPLYGLEPFGSKPSVLTTLRRFPRRALNEP